jgi:hypothetical protein
LIFFLSIENKYDWENSAMYILSREETYLNLLQTYLNLLHCGYIALPFSYFHVKIHMKTPFWACGFFGRFLSKKKPHC